MAYTIVLVDDEDEVRGRIASKIEGQEEFKVIGSAANGYDALDLLEDLTPDVVITDIKMPFVDGIELTRIIRDRYPTIRVAIISGYDDYSYLKEAINLDVAAYLSKPISNDNINEFLEKIKQRLNEDNEHVLLKEDMRLTQIRNRVLDQYLSNVIVSDIEEDLVHELGINSEKMHLVVTTEFINLSSNIIEAERKKNQCYLMIRELLRDAFNSYHLIQGKYIVSIIEVSIDNFEKELDIQLYKVVDYLKKYLAIKIAIGVSTEDNFNNLSDMYRQSQLALEEFEIADQSSINYYSNLKPLDLIKNLTVSDISEFKNNMRYMSEHEFMTYTNSLTAKLKKEHHYDYFNVMVTLVGVLIEYVNSIESSQSLNIDMNTIKSFVETKNIEGFMALLLKLTKQVKKEVLSRKVSKSTQIMKDILMFIEHNYTKSEMSMDMVCDELHISVSYLSALFKKETETTFNKYLVGKRIEHAKMLLSKTEDKMVNIAEKCGYKDVYYFSHSFKRVTGQTPKRYRKDETN